MAFGWEEGAKLAHLVSRLKGAALTYYRSCPVETRHSYALLKDALLKRFTPVHVQSVQGALFHRRSQKPMETVDEYAQELRALFRRAYLKLEWDIGGEGESVLTLRFIARLKTEIQKKLTAAEGTFDQILVRARYEEAQWQELKGGHSDETAVRRYMTTGGQTHQQSSGKSTSSTIERTGRRSPTRRDAPRRESRNGCYHCGSADHYVRQCPYKTRSQPKEALGGGKFQMRSNSLTTEAKAAGMEQKGKLTCQPGPRVTAKVWLDGVEKEALLDTGSPVTILSVNCLLDIWAMTRPELDAEEKRREALDELSGSVMTLRTYDGTRVPIVAEIQLKVKLRM